jgi:hypothetical protein
VQANLKGRADFIGVTPAEVSEVMSEGLKNSPYVVTRNRTL